MFVFVCACVCVCVRVRVCVCCAEARMGFPGVHAVTLSFNHLRVPRDGMLDAPSDDASPEVLAASAHGLSGKRMQFLAVSEGLHFE